MEKCSQNFFIVNGFVKEKHDFDALINQNDGCVYEVIRVIKATPLFLENHLDRLLNSVKLSDFDLPVSIAEIRYNILKLIDLNHVEEGNVKLILNGKQTSKDVYFAIWFQPHSYPTHNQYSNGVVTELLSLKRQNPNAKVQHDDYKSFVANSLAKSGTYEMILTDNEIVTEGTKSNIFFIQNKTVVTAPLNRVLGGITRQTIVNLLIKNDDFILEERDIFISELSHFQAAFISGTSPKVLPISEIKNVALFDVSNLVLRKIMLLYDDLISKNIQNFKK